MCVIANVLLQLMLYLLYMQGNVVLTKEGDRSPDTKFYQYYAPPGCEFVASCLNSSRFDVSV